MKLQTREEASLLVAESVERMVRSRTGGSIRNLKVEVAGGEIIISGITTTYYNKQLATHAALSALDDANLTNDIRVY